MHNTVILEKFKRENEGSGFCEYIDSIKDRSVLANNSKQFNLDNGSNIYIFPDGSVLFHNLGNISGCRMIVEYDSIGEFLKNILNGIYEESVELLSDETLKKLSFVIEVCDNV